MEELKYRREEEMKDSGIEWLGMIPKEWGGRKLKYLFSFQKGKNTSAFIPYGKDTTPYITAEFLRTGETDKYVSSINKLIKVKEGDLLLLWDGANAGEFFIGKEGVLGSTFAKFDILTNDNYDYLKYYAKSCEKYLKGMTIGMGIPHVNSDILKNIVFVKSYNIIEQQKIANFLDYKTSQFDSIISKKEKFIEKLEEAKKSLISEVVTGKIKIEDGQMVERKPEEMKDSGIEWLGMIPKDWEVTKIKYLLANEEDRIKIGPFGSNLKLSEMKEEYKYKVYGQENLIKEDFSLGTKYIDHNKFQEMKKYELLEGDIVISMMGTIGKSKVVPRGIANGIMDSHLIRIRVNYETVNRYFLNFLIREGWYIKEQLKKMNNGSIMSGLNSTIIKNLYVAKPTIEEQNMMLYCFNNKIAKLNTIIKKTKTQIQKLKEAKQSLISEAVTGKIDLRDWEIREVDEL